MRIKTSVVFLDVWFTCFEHMYVKHNMAFHAGGWQQKHNDLLPPIHVSIAWKPADVESGFCFIRAQQHHSLLWELVAMENLHWLDSLCIICIAHKSRQQSIVMESNQA